ncbi:Aste57867_6110 [Aphanomyces stellatus]|uniref:Aste57867_6110 protein n=1 Tax=Aphanomyces stellatus TaxID=120398 RepID=A0A485KFH2_9STRA|nr:hypothetical protein As57867_006096 [Aphanomyces stellatus]VFT83117.1 Aste57867_6110 [Aphanomyces stellatus]
MVDPTSPENWANIRGLARVNTDIFERVFQCLPSDAVVSYTQPLLERPMGGDVTEVYENQRCNWSGQWSSKHLLFNERPPWSDMSGAPLDDFVPEDGWRIDTTTTSNDGGWLYGASFGALDATRDGDAMAPRLDRCVRRRRWMLVENDAAPVPMKARPEFSRMLTRVNSISPRMPVLGAEDQDEEVALTRVQGHLVEFPLQFLRDCQLRPAILPKNIFI